MITFPVRLLGGPKAEKIEFENVWHIFSLKPDRLIFYPIPLLAQNAKLFENAPCHDGHRTVLTEQRPVIGRIKEVFWDWASVSLYGMFEPTSKEVETRIFEAYPGRTPALSIDVDTEFDKLNWHKPAWVIRRIKGVNSVDFEHSSFVGGEFITIPTFKRAIERQILTNLPSDRRFLE